MKFWLSSLIFMGGITFLHANSTLKTSTPPILPGQTLSVILNSDYQSPPVLKWADETVSFYQSNQNKWRALVRVPMDLRPGAQKLMALARVGELKSVGIPFQIQIGTSSFGHETIRFSSKKTKLLNDSAEDRESATIRDVLADIDVNKEQMWEGTFLRPVPGKMLSPFGIKRNKIGQTEPDFHKGVDFRAAGGSPIKAPNNARVVLVEDFKFHGKTILLDHGQGIGSIYLHMREFKVAKGERVQKGQVIGLIGSTGLSTAPHLHWGLYVHGEAVDPLQWLETEF